MRAIPQVGEMPITHCVEPQNNLPMPQQRKEWRLMRFRRSVRDPFGWFKDLLGHPGISDIFIHGHVLAAIIEGGLLAVLLHVSLHQLQSKAEDHKRKTDLVAKMLDET